MQVLLDFIRQINDDDGCVLRITFIPSTIFITFSSPLLFETLYKYINLFNFFLIVVNMGKKYLLVFYSPMEEQRHRYGPPLYNLTAMVLFIRLFLLLAWGRFEAVKL